jgi:hypothetical protein
MSADDILDLAKQPWTDKQSSDKAQHVGGSPITTNRRHHFTSCPVRLQTPAQGVPTRRLIASCSAQIVDLPLWPFLNVWPSTLILTLGSTSYGIRRRLGNDPSPSSSRNLILTVFGPPDSGHSRSYQYTHTIRPAPPSTPFLWPTCSNGRCAALATQAESGGQTAVRLFNIFETSY